MNLILIAGDIQTDIQEYSELTKALGEINMDKETQNRVRETCLALFLLFVYLFCYLSCSES